MNILYCYWGEVTQKNMIQALESLGHSVTQITFVVSDYDNDPILYTALSETLNTKAFDLIFSFDFFPVIAEFAHNMAMPYLCWVYDMPHNTLYSPYTFYPTNYIYIFDYSLYSELLSVNPTANIFHLPLASNPVPISSSPSFNKEVSFIGSLYENCLYNQITYLPKFLQGYFNSFFITQMGNYTYSLSNEIISKEILKQFQEYVHLDINQNYKIAISKLYIELIDKKMSSLDRIGLLRRISSMIPTHIYSNSNSELINKAIFEGTINYDSGMSNVFRQSKINLNITIRSIKSGVPLRCYDIMASGGFLLSNYQEELDKQFIDGQEMVQFFTPEDMLEKINYYLSHEKERKEIAHNGFIKTQNSYNYINQTQKMFQKYFSVRNQYSKRIQTD